MIKYILSLSFLIIAFSIGYYFVIYLPSQAQIRYELQQSEQAFKERMVRENQQNLETCVLNAEQLMRNNWNQQCKEKGLAENCSQSVEMVTLQDTRVKALKDECFKKYPQQ